MSGTISAQALCIAVFLVNISATFAEGGQHTEADRNIPSYQVGNVVLQIPAPDGYSVASKRLSEFHDMGKKIVGGSGTNRFVLFVRDGSVDKTGIQGDTLSISLNDSSHYEMTQQQFHDGVGSVEHDYREKSQSVFGGSFVLFDKGNGWCLCAIKSIKTLPKGQGKYEIYSMSGMVLIKGHVYTYNANLIDSSENTKTTARKTIELWLSRLAKSDKKRLGAEEACHGDAFYDLFSVGESIVVGKTIIDEDEYLNFDHCDWVDRRTSGYENAAGVDIKFKYPKMMDCSLGNQPHVVFHIEKTFRNPILQTSLSIGVWPYDEIIMAAIRQLRITDVRTLAFLELVEKMAEKHGRVIGAGITTMENLSVLWMTVENEKERLGIKLRQIMRLFFMPTAGRRCVVACVSVLTTKNNGWPYRDFELFNKIGRKFISSITFMDKSQVGTVMRFEGIGSGTGWFVSPEYVITCWHVLQGHSQYSFVKSTGQKGCLLLVGKDEFSDIAILRIVDRGLACTTPLKLSSDKAKVSQKVFTIGYPIPDLMGKSSKYTEGVISSLSGIGDDDSKLQITTPVQRGNSGGALINDRGEVVGVVQSQLQMNHGEELAEPIQNVNYAVKSFFVRRLMTKLAIALPVKYDVGDYYEMALKATVFIEVK